MFTLLTESPEGFILPATKTVARFTREVVTVTDRDGEDHNIFLKHAPAETQRALGWYELRQDAVMSGNTAGPPLDTLEAECVRRSFPDQTSPPRDEDNNIIHPMDPLAPPAPPAPPTELEVLQDTVARMTLDLWEQATTIAAKDLELEAIRARLAALESAPIGRGAA